MLWYYDFRCPPFKPHSRPIPLVLERSFVGLLIFTPSVQREVPAHPEEGEVE